MELRKAVECIRKHKSFIITAHTNLEGDALGSELAFYRLLKKLGKEAAIVNEDILPPSYGFLPGIDKIRQFKQGKTRVKFDCFVALDCSDLERTGEVYRLNSAGKTVLNIDHHISNRYFGNVNWVEPAASCTSEMVYKLYKAMRVPIDRDEALCMYVGILTDTGSFRYSNTTAFTHKVISELLKHRFKTQEIYKYIYEDIPFTDMKLLGRILPRMRQDAKGKVIWFEVPRVLLRNWKLSFDLSEHILAFGRAVRGVEVVVLFKENLGVRNEVRINFRSQGAVDVNKIASYFGGGGHKTASGATVRGKLSEVRKKVLSKIRYALQ